MRIRPREEEDESLLYLATGTIAAILLGMVLVPFRELTTAGNLAFPFLALVIVVAELGGRRAAVATALGSALSMNFFLTKPYLRLTIESKHDIIAFAGLTVCGLIAAAFGSARGRATSALGSARSHLDLLHGALRRIEEAGSVEAAIAQVLDSARAALPLAAVVVRDPQGIVVAASGSVDALPLAVEILRPDTLLPLEGPSPGVLGRGLPLPVHGGRVALRAEGRPVGWLDVWGNGSQASAESRRTLSDIARLVGTLLGRRALPSVGSE